MRVLPSVPAIGREAQEDFYYREFSSLKNPEATVRSSGDQLIRKGTIVNIFISGIHRDASVFPNPDQFDPSRFAEDSVTSEQRSPFAFIPFSAGSRNCIGQRFANLEERVVLSTLLRQFSFRSTQTIDELGPTSDVILRTESPILMFVDERKCE